MGKNKAQLSKNGITVFLKRLSQLDTGGLTPFPVLVTHMITRREVKDFAQEKGIALYPSYRFQKPLEP